MDHNSTDSTLNNIVCMGLGTCDNFKLLLPG